ncbi:patatin-like phospholipase family protein [Ramlibacter sp. MMS24-I3-19]|uniref:patatin-like phospholipase family protein n=1 Tax=Ramlibacter sp. MMS24-I3-19 TaxID=3416606 RepID=UPI003D010BBD
MRTINLALQGGGSHGAFTWGVLDAFLADPRIALEGLSGTSAGAVNAVVLASGYATARAAGHDPRQGARDALARLWQTIGSWDALGAWQRQWARLLWGGAALAHGSDWLSKAVGGSLSPYQTNPLDLNPLRDLLREQVDFHAVADGPLKVFATATHVPTGRAVIFSGARLDAAAVLASACLPQLFKAVEIQGEPYWDGGYSANPALTPLIQGCTSADLMLVQINPLRVPGVPQSSADIEDRVNELTFNASLLTQMHTIESVNSLIAAGALRGTSLKTVRMHRVDGGEAIRAFPGSTKTSTDAAMIETLFRIGQQAATHWLQRHYDALGHHGTVDIRRDYLDDTRVSVAQPESGATRPPGGFRPWLARLLRRRGS